MIAALTTEDESSFDEVHTADKIANKFEVRLAT